jgi:hypothetical protein
VTDFIASFISIICLFYHNQYTPQSFLDDHDLCTMTEKFVKNVNAEPCSPFKPSRWVPILRFITNRVILHPHSRYLYLKPASASLDGSVASLEYFPERPVHAVQWELLTRVDSRRLLALNHPVTRGLLSFNKLSTEDQMMYLNKHQDKCYEV